MGPQPRCCVSPARTRGSTDFTPPAKPSQETRLLSPADGAIVQRDVALPDLALLLDPGRLLAAIRRTLGGRRLGVPSITYLRYKPGVNCLAACSMDVDGEAVHFSAKALRREAGNKLQKLMMRSAVNGPLGSGRFVLVDTSVVVSVFPN